MKKQLTLGHLFFILSLFSCEDESDLVERPYLNSEPTIEGFSIQPVAGPTGSYVTITGSNLFQEQDNVMIQFGTVAIA